MPYNPVYTWPSDHFPFRLYLESDKLRIFLIENIFHNYHWLKQYSRRIRDNDIFLVFLGWHHGDWHARHSKSCIEDCGLDIKSFIILCNSLSDLSIFSDHGFTCRLVNQNCFLDSKLFQNHSKIEKIYDAVYVGRLTPFKRHNLASSVNKLALVTGSLHGADLSSYLPPHEFINSQPLTPAEVNELICSSKTGLILSEIEGACYASSEYLLSGIPVVSTLSQGGRDVWYNDYNSIICEPTPEAVSNGVLRLIDRSPCPNRIRSQHICLANYFQNNFKMLLSELFCKHSLDIDPEDFFNRNFFNKMRNSLKPDFEKIFP